MTTSPQGSALDELRAAYHQQLVRLAAERDAARRQARRAQAQADVARADLASLKSRVQELLNAAARHLPDLPAAETTALETTAPETTAASELPAARRPLPAGPDGGDPRAAGDVPADEGARSAQAA